MNNFADDVDLVDDCAPMPGETKPTLKSNPSGNTYIPVTKNNQPEKSEPVTTQKLTKAQKRKNKTLEQPTFSNRKNASSFMMQSYVQNPYPKGIPKTFFQTAQPQSMSGVPYMAGIPRSFQTPEHLQMISQFIQTSQQQNLSVAQKHIAEINQQKQLASQLPSLMSIDTSKPFQPTTVQLQTNAPSNQQKTGFKPTFQPIETQQRASQININTLKAGERNNSANTSDANKSASQKQQLKADKKKQDEKTQPQSSTSTAQQQKPQQTTIQQQSVTVPTEENELRQVYSPSELYQEPINFESEEEENNDDGDGTPGSKRLSAFRRLGPVTQPKKPKMTINWLCNKDVREVVETVEDEDVPVHLRKYIQMSTDDIVLKYLTRWPWVNPPPVRRTVSARHSKSVMILEQEQMDDLYKKDSAFFQISITGYPDKWTKEDVLDAVLNSVKGHSFIPCFIEFSKSECKFLVIRSRTALLQLHKLGFVIKKDDVTLSIIIAVISLNVNVLEFVPRLILMKRLSNCLTGTELNLKAFTLQKDVSHFIYFPLERQANQIELLKLQCSVQWELLTKLDLSYNKLTSLNGFFLKISTPKLKYLDLSYNALDKISCLFHCRDLPLKSITLEGNPLCNDYISQEHYIKVLKMLFSELVEIDGIHIVKPPGLPPIKQNYCTEEAKPIIETVLEIFFPLLETPVGERLMIQDMYADDAVLTITHMPRLRYSPIYLDFRSLFKYARILEEDELLCIKGASNIAKVLCKWPLIEHDPYTFTVDLMYHMDTTIVFRISGMFKLVTDTLSEDEPLLHFTRTFVLNSKDGVEYKICNDMVYWELPSNENTKTAFKNTSVSKRQPSLNFESPPDEEIKEKLLQIFMNLTQLDKKPSQKCLEYKNWNLRNALDYYVNLLKLDNLDPIMK